MNLSKDDTPEQNSIARNGGFAVTATLALVLGVAATLVYERLNGSTPELVSTDGSEIETRPLNDESRDKQAPDQSVALERLQVEEILGLAASKEKMKWRIQELSETERLDAERKIAFLTGEEADTPLEVLIDLAWERWNAPAAKLSDITENNTVE